LRKQVDHKTTADEILVKFKILAGIRKHLVLCIDEIDHFCKFKSLVDLFREMLQPQKKKPIAVSLIGIANSVEFLKQSISDQE
jgi:Cdc6-like AAA superfamily ATPase